MTREAFTALNLKAAHVAVSEVRRDEFCKLTGIKPKDCRVVPNGIDSIATLGLTPAVANLTRKHQLLSRDVVLFLTSDLAQMIHGQVVIVDGGYSILA